MDRKAAATSEKRVPIPRKMLAWGATAIYLATAAAGCVSSSLNTVTGDPLSGRKYKLSYNGSLNNPDAIFADYDGGREFKEIDTWKEATPEQRKILLSKLEKMSEKSADVKEDGQSTREGILFAKTADWEINSYDGYFVAKKAPEGGGGGGPGGGGSGPGGS